MGVVQFFGVTPGPFLPLVVIGPEYFNLPVFIVHRLRIVGVGVEEVVVVLVPGAKTPIEFPEFQAWIL